MLACTFLGCGTKPNFICGCKACAPLKRINEKFLACTEHTQAVSDEHQRHYGCGALWFWFVPEAPTATPVRRPTYAVRMSAMARVTGIYRTEADSPEHAKEIARERSGDVAWKYAGTDDESVEIDSVTLDK